MLRKFKVGQKEKMNNSGAWEEITRGGCAVFVTEGFQEDDGRSRKVYIIVRSAVEGKIGASSFQRNICYDCSKVNVAPILRTEDKML